MGASHKDKVAVVTGGAAGLGQAFAVRLAQEGCHVVIVDIVDATETLELIAAEGREGYAETRDITSESEVAALASNVQEKFGRCDILVNNAAFQQMVPFDQLDFATWRRTQSVNIDAAFLLAKAFVPGMRERKFGRIINMASSSAWAPNPGFSAYITSKMANIGFTRGLAKEVGNDGITVNAIAPGLTRTKAAAANVPQFIFDAVCQQQLIQRTGEPDDLCGALVFLTSADASFITGQTYHVDGGAVL